MSGDQSWQTRPHINKIQQVLTGSVFQGTEMNKSKIIAFNDENKGRN